MVNAMSGLIDGLFVESAVRRQLAQALWVGKGACWMCGDLAKLQHSLKLQHSFHWFELYLGILLVLAMLAAIATLACKYQQRR